MAIINGRLLESYIEVLPVLEGYSIFAAIIGEINL